MITTEYTNDKECYFLLNHRNLKVETIVKYDEPTDVWKVAITDLNCFMGYSSEELGFICDLLTKAKNYCDFKNMENVNKQGSFNFYKEETNV